MTDLEQELFDLRTGYKYHWQMKYLRELIKRQTETTP